MQILFCYSVQFLDYHSFVQDPDGVGISLLLMRQRERVKKTIIEEIIIKIPIDIQLISPFLLNVLVNPLAVARESPLYIFAQN